MARRKKRQEEPTPETTTSEQVETKSSEETTSLQTAEETKAEGKQATKEQVEIPSLPTEGAEKEVRPAVKDVLTVSTDSFLLEQKLHEEIAVQQVARARSRPRTRAHGADIGELTHVVYDSLNQTPHELLVTLPLHLGFDQYCVQFVGGRAQVPSLVAERLRRLQRFNVQ
jgi:hypothetical protein